MSWNNNVYPGILKSASGSNAVKIPVPQLAVIMIHFPQCMRMQMPHVFCSNTARQLTDYLSDQLTRLSDASPSQYALSSRSGRKPFLQLQVAPASKLTQAEFSVQMLSSAQKS